MHADVAVVRMDHPRKNALAPRSIEWLARRLDDAGGRPLLLCGTQDAFCAGLDLLHVAGLAGAEMDSFLRSIDALAVQLATYPGPTVALVEGHAIAGGCVLARACDHAVARDAPRVRIGVNEVALGVCFPPRILRLMRARLPARHARRVLLGAELFDPPTACELGLVDEVSGEPERLARERLERMAAHPASAVALTKRALARGLEADDEDERRFREELRVWSSDEVRARIRAVLGK
jgi:enoyl-CoA hydratase/carnithine racemase